MDNSSSPQKSATRPKKTGDAGTVPPPPLPTFNGAGLQATTTTTSNWLLGYVCFNFFFFLAVGFNVALLYFLYQNPRTVGLYLLLPYYTYVLCIGREEYKEGFRNHAFSRNFFLFQWMRQFLNLRLVVVDDAKEYFSSTSAEQENNNNKKNKKESKGKESPSQQFLFAVFPHGVNCDYRILMDGMLHTTLPAGVAENVRALAATVLFRIPLVRELSLLTGCVDASRKTAHKLLQNGKSILVLPGGQAEQIRTVYGQEEVYLTRRKGFIKLAMQQNPVVPVVPVYAFGCSDYYYTSSLFLPLRLWLVKTTGVAIPLATGLWGSLLCPRPVETTVVFGKPLYFPCKDPAKGPTTKEIDEAHATFCSALIELFNDHKEALGYGDRTLEII